MRSRRALDFRRIKLVETVDYVDKDANIADISCIQCKKSVEKVPFEKKHGQRNTEISGAKRSRAKITTRTSTSVPDMARRREELDKIFGQIELRKQKRLKCERKNPRIPDCDEPWSRNALFLNFEVHGKSAVSPSLSPLISPLLSPFDNKQEHCFLTERLC